jgi:tRNA pseudouridine38-40 synthase
VEYDGSGFAGWARQPGLRTVQEEVERALTVALRAPAGELVSVTVAGRTDAGVHAWGQVCSYAGEPALVGALSRLLPGDVAALSCSAAAEGFDARRDATSRAYCYRVLARPARSALEAGRVLHWPVGVDFARLGECAEALVDVHDFTAFTPTETEHVRFSRQVYAAFWRRSVVGAGGGGGERGGAGSGGGGGCGGAGSGGGGGPGGGGELLEFWIEADAFMRHMNRVLVGTMLEVAGGRRTVSSFVELLDGRPRAEAGPTAPAHGLYLAGVGYGGERVLGL